MGTPLGWRLLTAAAMFALTIPRLWQPGMFLDGVTYAVVARNMAAGIGSFWAPSFSATLHTSFAEQPPLGLGLQALAFLVFGDHLWVERAYAVAVFLLNGACVAALARRCLPAAVDWVPVLLWLVLPVVTWVAVNNMLENTQAVFTSAACLALLRTAGARPRAADVAWGAAAGISVVAAVLTKGPVGLFPLSVPLLTPLLPPERRPARPVLIGATLCVVVLGAAAGLTAYPPSRDALAAFAHTHLAPTLSGARGIGPRGLDAVRHLLLGIGLRLGVVAALVWIVRRRVRVEHRREARFFLALGLAGSVPILVSPLLAGHYFFPATVFFALGAAAMLVPADGGRDAPARRPWLPHVLAAVLAVLVCGTLAIHGVIEPRDTARIRSLRALDPFLPRDRTVGTCAQSATDWGLHGYLQRLARISLDPVRGAERGWFLQDKAACLAPPGCVVVADAPALAWLRCARGLTAGGAGR
jgi:4-amino-4-deoxy-L-arabinose transferase-like glycosyltransferase